MGQDKQTIVFIQIIINRIKTLMLTRGTTNIIKNKISHMFLIHNLIFPNKIIKLTNSQECPLSNHNEPMLIIEEETYIGPKCGHVCQYVQYYCFLLLWPLE